MGDRCVWGHSEGNTVFKDTSRHGTGKWVGGEPIILSKKGEFTGRVVLGCCSEKSC